MRSDLRVTIVLSAAAYFVMTGVSIISPVLSKYALFFAVPYVLVGLLIAVFGLARLMLDIPSGMLCDRIGTRKLMLYGLAIIAISSVIAGLAVDYWMLLLGRILEGAGSALYSTTSLTIIGRIAPKEKRGAYLSGYLGMFLLGTATGPALGGFAALLYGLTAPFFLYALFAAISFFLVLFLIKEKETARSDSGTCEMLRLKQITPLLGNYTVMSVNIATFAIFTLRQGVIGTIVPLYAYYNLGMNEGMLGIVLTISAVFNIFTMLLAGRLTDRFGRKPFLFMGIVLTGVCAVLIPFSRDVITFTVIMAAMGLCIGLSGPLVAWIADVVRPSELAPAMGLFRTVGDAGFVIAPILLSGLAGGSGAISPLPFILAGVTVCCISLLLLFAHDPIHERAKRI